MMPNQGLDEATLYVNRRRCLGVRGCDALLLSMLPEGSQLRVVAPPGFNQTYLGLPDNPLARPQHDTSGNPPMEPERYCRRGLG